MKKTRRKFFTDKLLAYMKSNPGQVYKSRDLAKKFSVRDHEYQDFKKLIKDLSETNIIARHKGNRYGAFQNAETVSGELIVKTQGYGFVRSDKGGDDVFISQKNMGSALHKDRVKVALWAHPVGKLPEGRVVEVLKRGREKFVGIFQKSGNYAFVTPDDIKVTRDIAVQEKNSKEAKPGQKVVVEIISWQNARRMPEGKIIKVLGFPDEKGVNFQSIVHALDLPGPFPQEVIREVEAIDSAVISRLSENRKDFRDRFIFTIDPETAKDFDDAVSLEILPNGNRILGVHIADVSAFVQPGSLLDQEALQRGTSIYMANQVIPMLPHVLSSDLCSLKPDEERLTYSVLMEITPDLVLESYEICESVIRSHHRLSYEQAQAHLDASGRAKGSGEAAQPDLRETLKSMWVLASELKEKWRNKGSLDFNAPEAEFIFNDEGEVVDIKHKKLLQSHQLIEAFMLMANQTVSRHIQNLRQNTGRKVPFIYRIHEPPGKKSMEEFTLFVRSLGYGFDPGKRMTPMKFQTLLNKVKGTQHALLIEEVMLRAMMKAVYSTRNAGHFGLAFGSYTHFTSPIRRYPDLAVHRLLKAYAAMQNDIQPLAYKLSHICEVSTDREIRAQEAERESVRALQVAFMEKRIGEEYDGIIAGVTAFGFFVEIPEYLIEGLIHIRGLSDDYYLLDERHHTLIGQHTGRHFKLGDPVRIRVVRVLHELRKIDFSLVE